jgi:hypothetical protein
MMCPVCYEDIESAVEMRSDYGRQAPDYEQVLDDLEVDGLDRGNDMDDPAIKEILKVARRVYKELKESA